MYQTTTQFITAARELKQAFLISLIVGEPLHIETGRPGSVPCVPPQPYRVVLNRNFALEATPSDEADTPVERYLARQFLGKRIPIATNFDSPRDQLKVCQEGGIVLNIHDESDSRSFAEAVRDRCCYSLTLSMPPAMVIELLDYVTESPEFSDQNIIALKAKAGTAARTGRASRVLSEGIVTAIRATREDTDEAEACRNSGLAASFGYGAGARGMKALFSVCCADAAVSGRTEFSKDDIIRLFAPVVAHRIMWKDRPAPGHRQMLTKVAEWAVNTHTSSAQRAAS